MIMHKNCTLLHLKVLFELWLYAASSKQITSMFISIICTKRVEQFTIYVHTLCVQFVEVCSPVILHRIDCYLSIIRSLPHFSSSLMKSGDGEIWKRK